MQRDHERLKMANAPKWTSSLASPLEKNSLAHYELAYSKRSGRWRVDSDAEWGTEKRRKTNVEGSKGERVGGPFALSP